MKAVRFHEVGGPEVLRLDEVPDPEPGDGDVLVRLAASAVNPAEVSRRGGRMGQVVDLPAMLGIEGAGVVARVGKDVASVRVGDRVIARQPPYSYAEYVVVPERSVYAVPDNLSLVEASTLTIIYTTAWSALRVRGGGKEGDTVLVQAVASGVGIAAVQLAKQLGMTVLGTASSAEKARVGGAVRTGPRHQLRGAGFRSGGETAYLTGAEWTSSWMESAAKFSRRASRRWHAADGSPYSEAPVGARLASPLSTSTATRSR